VSDLEQRVLDWATAAPPEVREWLGSISVRNFLRLSRQVSFQMPGRYDGAMSEESKQTFRNNSAVADGLLRVPQPRASETC
jgi:hypothetical protein